MTIAQEFVEMGKAMGLDTSDCKTGNIVETLNAMTLKAGGEVSDSALISTAMMNFRNAVYGGASGEGTNPQEPETPTEPDEPEENDDEDSQTEP